jgi:hypothetical protein
MASHQITATCNKTLKNWILEAVASTSERSGGGVDGYPPMSAGKEGDMQIENAEDVAIRNVVHGILLKMFNEILTVELLAGVPFVCDK